MGERVEHVKTRLLAALCCVALALLVFAVYHDVGTYDFIEFDDPFFIDAPHIHDGLTLENIKRAFTTTRAIWFPITWISHMVDTELYGSDPAGHHYTNLLFHVANTILLFLCLFRMTAMLWPSMLVAALFAVHPLNTETVCYISCRKGLLAAFFGFLSILSYSAYSARPTVPRYLVVAALFVLGMMAKPMLVTLPLLFLVLDYWPLERFKNTPARRLFYEKAPLLLISLCFTVLGFVTQYKVGAVSPLSVVPLSDRVANALVSYVTYILKMVAPVSLSVFYPFPESIPFWKPAACATLLAYLTFRVYKAMDRFPYLLAGWLWYLVCLLPMSGLVQAGSHAMADRYAYVPLVGLFIATAWSLNHLVSRRAARPWPVALLALVVVVGSGVAAFRQSSFWKDSITLFTHALKVGSETALVHNNLGKAFYKKGDLNAAKTHIAEALRLNPYLPQTNYNRGLLLLKAGRPDLALPSVSRAVQVQPDFLEARYTLANILFNMGRYDEALNHYSYIAKNGKDAPDSLLADTYNDMGVIYVDHGKTARAETCFREAVSLNPSLAAAHNNLGLLLFSTGRQREAGDCFEKAISLDRCFMDAISNLVTFYRQAKEYGKAIALLERSASLCPQGAISICYNIACLYSLSGDRDKAVMWLKRAVDSGFDLWNVLMSDEDLKNIKDTKYYRQITSALKRSLPG